MTEGWLARALGLSVRVDRDAYGAGLDGLAGLALRRNPRRAHLLVGRVLGKHLPVDPAVALAAGAALAGQVPPAPGPPLVVGYCETATSLGHAVADALPGSTYLHSTRRVVPGCPPLLRFEEAHSHASHHWLMPADPDLLHTPRPIVLVDDELSTGRTAVGTIRALHRLAPHPSYTVAALLDLRQAAERSTFDRLADELAVPVRAASLLSGELLLPADVADRARAVLVRHGGAAARSPAPCHPVRRVSGDWPAELPDGARHGWGAADGALLGEVLPPLAAMLDAGGRTLVLGTEELMYTPMRLAALLPGHVVYHSTTRSPVHPVDRDGYAVRTALTFPAPDDPSRASHVYNVRPGAYDDIVLVVDGGDPSGAVGVLRRCAPVTVVTVPSYRPLVTVA